MAGQEGAGLGGVGEDTVGGRPQVPAVRLRRTVEVTPIRVSILSAGHPQHRGRLWTSGTGAEGSVYCGPILWPWRDNTRYGGHPTAHETGGPSPPIPNKY